MVDFENKTLEDYEGEEVERAMYRYLKTKYDSDPETLTEMEGGLLLLCSVSRHLSLQERKQKYIEFYHGQYEKALALVNGFESGSYQGAWNDFFNAYFDTMPAEADLYVRQLGEINLLMSMNDLGARFQKLCARYQPLQPKTSFTQKEIQCINEEHAALIAAGYPANDIEAEAQKRGTFKAAYGADKLPPIQV